MPKPLPITIEVEEAYAGAVIRALHRMPGIASLHLNLDQDVRPPTGLKMNGQPRKLPRNGSKYGPRRLVYELLDGGKPKHRDEISAVLNPGHIKKKNGLVRNVLYNATNNGFLKEVSKGMYALTAKGQAQYDAVKGSE